VTGASSLSECHIKARADGLEERNHRAQAKVFGWAHANVIKNNMKAADSVDKALKRAEEIFSGFTI
jgi:hypothetical protein